MLRSVLVIVILSSLAFDASAQAPSKISFQGYLTDDLGSPISGSQSMTFKLYRGGTEIWSEPQTVTVNDGIFNVALGRGVDLDTVAFDDAFQLGVTVGKDPEMPRISLLSAAYARALPGLYTFYRDIGVSDGYNVIGGSEHNIVGTDVVMGTIGGGGRLGQPNAVTKTGATVGGGIENTGSGTKSTVAGGKDNTASGESSTVGGGEGNTASAVGAGVFAGFSNDATGESSTVAGGANNTASGQYATVVGGAFNTAGGGYSLAAGRNAVALHGGAFVWSDSAGSYFSSSGPNQFLIDAKGGVGIGTNAPGSKLTVNGRIESETGGFRFPDGTTQTSAAATVTDYWKLGGNSGTTPGSDFIGTSDATDLEIRSGGDVDISTANLDFSAGPGPATFLINADSDDSGDTDNALIQMRQDGGNIGVNIGFVEGGFGSDVFGIGRRNTGTNLYDTFVMQVEDGDVGIGTNDPGNNRLRVMNARTGGTATATLWAENKGSASAIAAFFKSTGTDATVVITNDGSGDLLRAFSSAGDLEFAVRNNGDVDYDGTLSTPASDLAESFDVEGSSYDYEPGDLLEISVSVDRSLRKSDRPYSTRVAGVYATKPGVLLGARVEGRTVPMGVVGVLPTKVSAENGPIQRGDLLVSSSTPGHAMKAEPLVINGVEIYPTGTILGKALEPFEGSGTGMIEVLVNTQ